ncbi:MAG: arginine repressor [Clostridia bacterium]|nr:arginine repressor [Clostridia bacterium]
MSRNARQTQILGIIAQKDIETQEELVAELKLLGFAVTQATISRDIKELNLVKAPTADDKYRYVTRSAVDCSISSRGINLLRDTIASIVTANNLIVVKTIHSSATAVSAILEQMSLEGVLGVVGSGDSLLIVTNDTKTAQCVENKLKKLVF